MGLLAPDPVERILGLCTFMLGMLTKEVFTGKKPHDSVLGEVRGARGRRRGVPGGGAQPWADI